MLRPDAYAPPEGWYLVAAERRRIAWEERHRITMVLRFNMAGAQRAFAQLSRSMERAAEQLRRLGEVAAADQRRRGAALTQASGALSKAIREGRLSPPER